MYLQGYFTESLSSTLPLSLPSFPESLSVKTRWTGKMESLGRVRFRTMNVPVQLGQVTTTQSGKVFCGRQTHQRVAIFLLDLRVSRILLILF